MRHWVQPTVGTKFHIDLGWWQDQGRDLRVYLHQHLCSSCRDIYTSHIGSETVDWVDPDTAEVSSVDGLWHNLRTHCSMQPDYITESTPLTNAVFRIFLANGNMPLTPVQLSEQIGHPPETILRVLGKGRVYAGIRPTSPDQ